MLPETHHDSYRSTMKEIAVEDHRPSRYATRSFTTSYVDFSSVAPALRTGGPVASRSSSRTYHDKHHQTPRRVTFDLPPCDGAEGSAAWASHPPGGSTAVGSVAEVAGVKNWLRSRRIVIQSREVSSTTSYVSQPASPTRPPSPPRAFNAHSSSSLHSTASSSFPQRSGRSTAHHFASQVAHETAGYKRGTLPDTFRLYHDTAFTHGHAPRTSSYSYALPPTTTAGGIAALHAPPHQGRRASSSTSSAAPACTELGLSLLKACRDGEEEAVMQLVRRATMVGASSADLNAVDHTGRTALSYLASNGSMSTLEALAMLPGVDANVADTEGNTPLHFASQAGHADVLNILLSRCSGVDVDARNALGFTPLMKAALQGRTKCAKLLLIAGASPTLKDTGRGFRAEQWARFCGRYVCAEAIEKLSRNRLLERNGANGRWGSEPALGDAAFIRPHVELGQRQSAGGAAAGSGGGSSWLRSKLRRAFRSSTASVAISEPTHNSSIVTQQLTSAALCASSPVLPPTPATTTAKFLLRGGSGSGAPPVPKLHVTPAVPGVVSARGADIPREQRPSVTYRVATGGPKKKKK